MMRAMNEPQDQQPDLLAEEPAPAPARPADPWMDGFAEGRRSMARSIALKLRGSMPDEDLASLVGLAPADLESLLAPPDPRPEEPPPAAPAAPAFIRGLALVEPNFVRVVRVARGLTQAQLARQLFPLGGLEKAEVRRIAREHGLTGRDLRETLALSPRRLDYYAKKLNRLTGGHAQ